MKTNAVSIVTETTLRRGPEADLIREAYDRSEDALRHVGKLLRTTSVGQFMWATEHKTAIIGLCAMIRKLQYDVPYYNDHEELMKLYEQLKSSNSHD